MAVNDSPARLREDVALKLGLDIWPGDDQVILRLIEAGHPRIHKSWFDQLYTICFPGGPLVSGKNFRETLLSAWLSSYWAGNF